MPRILLITYFFPPDRVIEHKRSYRIAKGIAENGWDIDVITVNISSRGGMVSTTLSDDSLQDWQHLEELPENVHIYRTHDFTKEGHLYNVGSWRRFKWPDPLVTWTPFALKQAQRLLRQNNYNVIISNSYPYTSHLIAHLICLYQKLPWIIDMRDAWIHSEYFPQLVPVRLNRLLHRWWTDKIMKRASSVWSLTPSINQTFIEQYRGKLDIRKFVTIMAGADFNEIQGIPAKVTHRDKFILVYAGSFREHIFSSDGLLQGLQLLRQTCPELAEKLLIRVYGRLLKNQPTEQKAHLYKVREFFDFQPMLPQREMLSYLKSSSAQLLLNGLAPLTKRRLSGKLFDYLAVGRPILALAANDSTIAQVICETNTGWVVPPDRPDLIASQLAVLLKNWQVQKTLSTDIDYTALKKYSFYDTIVPQILAELKRVTTYDK